MKRKIITMCKPEMVTHKYPELPEHPKPRIIAEDKDSLIDAIRAERNLTEDKQNQIIDIPRPPKSAIKDMHNGCYIYPDGQKVYFISGFDRFLSKVGSILPFVAIVIAVISVMISLIFQK